MLFLYIDHPVVAAVWVEAAAGEREEAWVAAAWVEAAAEDREAEGAKEEAVAVMRAAVARTTP